jgi:hypothetical protein
MSKTSEVNTEKQADADKCAEHAKHQQQERNIEEAARRENEEARKWHQ